ncbi:MAG: hypothetical protein LBS88_09635 [Tannerellaceae bacterium]|jgi:hypothetical protein|nr:hypothetical protein [Tannerellaceae bacterium]
MKHKILIYAVLSLVAYALSAQVVTDRKVTWDYSVKPGTEEWKKFNSPEEIYQALQIPENILKEINTESLVQICLNYSAPTVFYIYNAPQQGFDGFHTQFNGIRELMRRKDAGFHLLNKYADMSMKDFNPLWTLEEQGKFVEKFYYMELFLVQPTIMQSFSKEERKILLQESVNKFDMKLSRGDLFGGLNPLATVWIMARALHAANKLNMNAANSPEIAAVLESGLLTDFDAISIYQQVKSYCNE